MTLTRSAFFLALTGLIVLPFLGYKLWWLLDSRGTRGVMAFVGQGEAGEQVRLDYTVIYFRVGKDTVWFNGMGNLNYKPDDSIPVRYRPSDPSDAKVDIFAATWGDTLVYSGIPALMLLAVSLHPQVVPYRSRIRLLASSPFLRIVPERSSPEKSSPENKSPPAFSS